ncbi:MAG: hypothetical protein QOF48_2594 [Verrucomicrobiota bacterium]|jgi:hypothetical protein
MTIQNQFHPEIGNAGSETPGIHSETDLLVISLAAVQTIETGRLRAASGSTAPLRPQMLLTLLTYCYLQGKYDSRDIVEGTLTERTLRYICAGTRPQWTDLRRFRRQHRDMVAGCLGWALGRLTECVPGVPAVSAEKISEEVAQRLGAAALLDGADGD